MVLVRKFSLLELICTMGLIAIILCVAVPVYMKVKATAQGVICTSHLRSLGMAFGQYTADNYNLLPHHDDGSDAPPKGFVWYQKVLPYLNSDEEGEGVKYRQDAGYDPLETDINKIIFSYKMNSRLEDYKGSKKFNSGPFRDLSTIRFPSKTVLIFDGRTDTFPYDKQPYGPPTYVHARHCDKAGILFLDWSVKMVEGETDEKGYWKNGNQLIWDPDFDN